MALRGTLKDFGIADIFQLIAHQTKTGQLVLKNRESEVKVSFREGNVVNVESTTRQKKELLGALLVRAEVLTDAQLDEALSEQKRTIKRLGDVLVQRAWVTRETLNEFTRLQTTETIYRLFTWENGTYEFVQNEVHSDDDFGEAMRAESVLMEGFRLVDEWPMIRKKISGYGMRFAVIKSLPDAPDEDFNLDDAFAEMGDAPEKKTKTGDEDIGASERRVHSLVDSTRDVQKLIDLSRIGEFETCKALTVLLSKGYIEARDQQAHAPTQVPVITGGLVRDSTVMPMIVWSVLGVVVVGLTLTAMVLMALSEVTLLPKALVVSVPPALQAVVARGQRARIAEALETLRLQEGKYPDSLAALVSAGILRQDDLDFPAPKIFVYRRTDTGYELSYLLP